MYYLIQIMITLKPAFRKINTNPCLPKYNSEYLHRYNIVIIDNSLNIACLMTSATAIFYNELKSMKKTLVNNLCCHIIEKIKLSLEKRNSHINNKSKNTIKIFFGKHNNLKFDKNYKKPNKCILFIKKTTSTHHLLQKFKISV